MASARNLVTFTVTIYMRGFEGGVRVLCAELGRSGRGSLHQGSDLLHSNVTGRAYGRGTTPVPSELRFGAAPANAFSTAGCGKTRGAVERVLGIGGLFFRARDPAALAKWYEAHLGVKLSPTSYEETPWQQEAGPTIFNPFPEATEYFGNPRQAWMVNFRVRDLDAMATQLRAAGVTIEIDPERYPNGRFGRLHDPEGNPVELWEPAVPGDST
jgi:glyoxylase I family protein